jgi:cytochrome o ubiquinol oxidase subunit 1
MKRRSYVSHALWVPADSRAEEHSTGAILGTISVAFASGMIWYIWRLLVLSAMAALVVTMAHPFDYQRPFQIPAVEVVETEDLPWQVRRQRQDR